MAGIIHVSENFVHSISKSEVLTGERTKATNQKDQSYIPPNSPIGLINSGVPAQILPLQLNRLPPEEDPLLF